MKIKILTYCLGLLVVGFVITANGNSPVKGKTSSGSGFIKIGQSGNFFAENTTNSNINRDSSFSLSHSHNYSQYFSHDFSIEFIIAHYENLYRTRNRVAAILKI